MARIPLVDRRTVLAFVGGLVLVAFMVYVFNPWRAIHLMERADPRYLALALAIQVLDLLLWALRWHVVLRRSGLKAPFLTVFLVNNVSMLVNNVTPSARSGGEPVRVFLLAKATGYRMREVASTVVVDRVLDYAPLVFLMGLTAVFTIEAGAGELTYIAFGGVGLLTGALIGALYLLTREDTLVGIANKISRFLPGDRRFEEVERWVRAFTETLREALKDKGTLLRGSAVSFAVWSCELIRPYVVFESLGRPVPFRVVVIAYTVSMFAGVLPLFPGGLGLVELSTASVYKLFGLGAGISAAATLLDRLISYWFVNVVGLTSAFILTKRGLREVEDAIRARESRDDNTTGR
ncbi:MAG: UPF0104 family protein [Methanopyri archaeon]|nr:UPF0104 family protein [Methanopyri archaeon]